MAALSEDGRYGLNCGQQSADRVTVLHVKLTETAVRAIESYQNCTVSKTGVYLIRKYARTACYTSLSWGAQLPRTAKATKLAKLWVESFCFFIVILVLVIKLSNRGRYMRPWTYVLASFYELTKVL